MPPTTTKSLPLAEPAGRHENASLQLDPASALTRAQATFISRRLLRQVARWDEAIRRCDGVTPTTRIELVDAKERI